MQKKHKSSHLSTFSLISPTSYLKRRARFTLIELVVVLAVIGLSAAIAVPTMRKESPARQLTRTALEFQAFCARVRFQAMENTSDKLIRLDTEQSVFFMTDVPADPDSADTDPGAEEQKLLPENSTLRWKLPKDFTLSEDSIQPSDSDSEDWIVQSQAPEIFRFFPDGGASGKRKLTLRYGKLAKMISISALTGMTQTIDLDENNEPVP